MMPREFVEALAEVRLPHVFNPYADRCEIHDLRDAPDLRRRNLTNYLTRATDLGASEVWVARDLGYRGGRRTGIALTDEVRLTSAERLFGSTTFVRATKGPIVAERTAAIVWRALATVARPVVLWNVFPFHPHDPGDPLSNRCHTKAERETTLHLFRALLDLVRPREVIAIGRDAAAALGAVAPPASIIRHPSYGGQNEFIAGVERHYGVIIEPRVTRLAI
jgi:hypothetical protein